VGELGNGMVQVAYLHSDEVSYSWHDSMRRLRDHDAGRRIAPEPLNIFSSAGQIVANRNGAVTLFLDKTDAEWLFMIDTDMGFAPDTVDRLLEAADPLERPVVGALCFAMMYAGHDGMGGLRQSIVPTLYRIGRTLDGQQSFSYYGHYPPNTLVPVAATGAACILIHRGILEKLRTEYGDHWFDQVYSPNGHMIGEDFSFCARVNKTGALVHVHTGVKTTHHKRLWLAEDDYALASAAVDVSVPPPARERCAVIVPVMRRPDNAAPFMASLRASTGMATAYAVCDVDDVETIDAWEAEGARVIIRSWDGPGTFAEKVNVGYRVTTEPWLLLVGDDVRFWPGWLDLAERAAELTGAQVIGTNDLGNARVIAGEHATHMLIAREYVDELGASWDGPGVVAHEGYRHWYVDDEIVTTAKQRGVWTAATDSIIEHLHPLWGKADLDVVYEIGAASQDVDRARFAERAARHASAGV